MAAAIIDGKKTADEIQEEIKADVARMKERGVTPGLAVILVGESPASQVYVRNKEMACEKAGMYSRVIRMADDVSEGALLAAIDELNNDSAIHGILVQLPLPKHIDESKVIHAISPAKDVDGFHPVSLGKLMIGEPCFLPCTPHGIQVLLARSGVEISGKHVVVVGRSNIVGKPVAMILVQKAKDANAIVTICHSAAADLTQYTKQADILIVAVGKAQMITGDMVKEGVAVIDVGINRIENPDGGKAKLVGDVDFDSVSKKASYITPVPGGVGPMTITMLLKNTLKAAEMAAQGDVRQ